MAQKNTAELWDDVWARPANVEKDLFRVGKEERLVRWQRIEAKVLERFGSFAGLSVIELGAGRGTNAALMAQRGAKVAVLDYSETALDRSRNLFAQLEIPVEFMLHDALDLPQSLLGKFDVSMSFGLAEHFLNEQRAGILEAHFDLLNDRGVTFISVPNAQNPPYRLYKWVTERTGRWTVGEEYPFTRRELANYCAEFGVDEYGFFGDSLWRSKKFLNPIKWVPRRKRKQKEAAAAAPAAPDAAALAADLGSGSAQPTAQNVSAPKRRRRRRLPRPERGTSLDAHYSYALVLWGARPQPNSTKPSTE